MTSRADESLRNQISEVCRALSLELEEARQAQFFSVRCIQVEREFCVVTAHPDGSESSLHHNLEGCKAHWPGGKATILSVIPESDLMNLWYLTGEPPKERQQLWVTEPDYLKDLLDLWRTQSWSASALQWLQEARSRTDECYEVPDPMQFPTLRCQQAAAFKLPAYRLSYLWGPPGTGKTYTLGAMVAEYLVTFPDKHVLILAQVNSSVDQALLAIDDRVRELAEKTEEAGALRGRYIRIGNRWIARNYVGRESLLFLPDDQLVRKLAVLDVDPRQIHPEDNRRYAEWKIERAQLRAEIRKQVRQCLSRVRLAAMTTTYAAFALFDETRGMAPPFDLVVIDEGSQVPIAQAIMLAQLGRAVLIAGDPCQLRPVARSNDPLAQEWLKKSMFSIMPEQSTAVCFLDEQNRMASAINRVVSRVFYGDRLRVDSSSLQDHQWQAYRRLAEVHPFGARAVYCHEKCGVPQPEHQSWIRRNSADLVKTFVQNLLTSPHGIDSSQILVLTPFRAQRRLIQKTLAACGFSGVAVSTVHGAQGSERHTVIFDCVNGDTRFLREEGERIVNVALSRAQARVIVLISKLDRENNAVLELVARFAAASSDSECGLCDPASSRALIPGKPTQMGSPDYSLSAPGDYAESLMTFRNAYGKVKSVESDRKKGIIEVTIELHADVPTHPLCNRSDWPSCLKGASVQFEIVTAKLGLEADARSAALSTRDGPPLGGMPKPSKATEVGSAKVPPEAPISVDMLSDRDDWPQCLQGRYIRFRSGNRTVTGTVQEVNSDEHKILIVQDNPPAKKKYNLDQLRKVAAAVAQNR